MSRLRHSTVTCTRERMGPGGSCGLQHRWRQPCGWRGGFDSLSLPPDVGPHGVCLYAPSLAPPPASAESRLTVADLGKKVLLPHKPCPIQADKSGHVSLKSGRPNPLKPDTLCMGGWRKGPNRFGRFLQRVIGANACYFRARVVQKRNTEPEIMKCLWKMNRRRSGP